MPLGTGPGLGCANTPRALFAGLRARGIEPHPGGPANDEAAARVLVSLQATRGRFQSKTPEEAIAVSPTFGIAEGTFPIAGDDAEKWFGTYAQMVADIAAMGGGHIRRFKNCDLYWGSLFPIEPTAADSFQYGKQIPAPRDMLDAIAADGHACLAKFTLFLLACAAAGIKVSPTLFNAGGGAALNGLSSI